MLYLLIVSQVGLWSCLLRHLRLQDQLFIWTDCCVFCVHHKDSFFTILPIDHELVNCKCFVELALCFSKVRKSCLIKTDCIYRNFYIYIFIPLRKKIINANSWPRKSYCNFEILSVHIKIVICTLQKSKHCIRQGQKPCLT